MAEHTDSIQTLLKQRRELRDCLSELRNEISALNLKADTIVSKSESGAFGDGHRGREREGSPVSGGKEAWLPDQTIPPLGDASIEPNTVSPASNADSTTGSRSEIKAPLGDGMTLQAKRPNLSERGDKIIHTLGSDAARDIEQIGPVLSASKAEPLATKDAPDRESTGKRATKKAPVEILSKEGMKEFDDIDDESLYCRAKLLSDYFSNHPSPVANDVLVRLDTAIKSLNKAEASVGNKADVSELRDAYRDVSSKSFEKLGINGETLVDSRGDIGLLWGVPLFIAGLVLVLFPLILLLRSLAERMFIANFAAELSYTLTASAGFLWGCVGALSYVTWCVGIRAKKGSYSKRNSKDLALRAALGGVLGVVMFLCVVPFMQLDGILPDMSIGLLSFFIGTVSSILFVILYRLITSISRKVR
ncbi:MAG: hypothetical protein V7750_12750 [Sneathiella sp.]